MLNVYIVKGVTVFGCFPRFLALLQVLLQVLYFNLTTIMFSNYVKQRILYHRRLRKNYEGIASCLSEEGHKVTKVGVYKILKRFEGQGLLRTIQEDYTQTPKIILQVCTSELALLYCLLTARPYQMQTRC